jgi:hypothetical protein
MNASKYLNLDLRAALRRTLAGAALLGLAGQAAAAEPDLGPVAVVGPGTTYLDAPSLVTVHVANFGDPLVGDYTIEILLSADGIVDPSDPVVAVTTASGTGAINVPVTLPNGLSTGLQSWAARLSGAAGELALANNALVGTLVYVEALDLELADPSPLVFGLRPTDPIPAPIELFVNNLGSPGSVLVFSIQVLNPVPWLVVDPPSSFAVGGEAGQPITLAIDHTGVMPGVYPTTLRFQSWSHPADFVDLEVTLDVGLPRFVVGDRLLGQVAVPGDVDEMNFDGLKGMKLKLAAGVKSGDVATRVEIVDPDGQVEKVVNFKPSKKLIQKVVKLKQSGEYTLRVVDKSGNGTGGYVIQTNRRVPKAARPRFVKVTDEGGGIGDVEVRMLPGAKLDFVVKPNQMFAGPVALGFTTAAGTPLDILANILPPSGGAVRVENVLIQTVGAYWIHVAGFGGTPGSKAKVKVLPVQPKKGKSKLYLP